MLTGLLILGIGASVAIVVSTLMVTSLLEAHLRGEFVLGGDVDAAIERSVMFSRIGLAIFLLSGVAWLLWQHRAQANLHALLIPGLEYTPGWAVGWWLIPFANLFKPFQTVRELWKASDTSPTWRSTPTWPVIGWWWASWIVENVLGRVALSLLRDDPETVEALIDGNRWIVAAELAAVVAAVFAIAVVRAVNGRQARLEGAVTRRADAAPPRPDVWRGP